MISVVFYPCNQKTLCDVLHKCTENEIYVYEFRFLYLSANNNNIINITRLYGQTFKMRFFYRLPSTTDGKSVRVYSRIMFIGLSAIPVRA